MALIGTLCNRTRRTMFNVYCLEWRDSIAHGMPLWYVVEIQQERYGV
jgi:hypothetical protein